MIIYTLWGQRKSDPGTPELMVAWDGYSIAHNPEGFASDCDAAVASWGNDLETTRQIEIHIPNSTIEDTFDATVVMVDNKPTKGK